MIMYKQEVIIIRPYTEKDAVNLQNNLAAIRKVAGWTATDLGELIGVTKQTISNLENKKSTMTKTQYIAIRAVIDYEISINEDNNVLPQVVNILLDTDELSSEDQIKVDTTVAYVTGAKEKGMSAAAISAGVAALITALGIACGPAGVLVANTSTPLWLEAIGAAKRNKSK